LDKTAIDAASDRYPALIFPATNRPDGQEVAVARQMFARAGGTVAMMKADPWTK
jgi:hypothetical protein